MNEKGKDNGEKHGRKSTGWIVGIIVGAIASIILICSMGGSSDTKLAQNIVTADQWVTYCGKDANIHRCLRVFDKIDHTTQVRIWDDLSYMVAHLSTNDDKMRIKSDSWGYLVIYMKAREDNPKADAFYNEIYPHHIGTDEMWARIILTEKRMDELVEKYLNE